MENKTYEIGDNCPECGKAKLSLRSRIPTLTVQCSKCNAWFQGTIMKETLQQEKERLEKRQAEINAELAFKTTEEAKE